MDPGATADPIEDLVRAVRALSEQLGGGEVRAWVLVTDERSIGPNRVTGAITVGPVVDATATVRRMIRARTEPAAGGR